LTHSRPPDRPPRHQEPLEFDDFIGILVAFLSLGTVLVWGLARTEQGLNLSLPTAVPSQLPEATGSLESMPSNLPSNPPGSIGSGAIASPATVPTPTVPTPTVPAPVEQPPPPQVLPVPVVLGNNTASSATLTTPAAPQQSASQATSFTDLPSDFWALLFINELGRRNILVGFLDNTFRPSQPVTRAEFAVMIQKGFDQPQVRPTLQFTDLAPDFWAIPAIDKAVQMEFMKGYPDGFFRPEQSITKLQALIALANGLRLPQPPNPTTTLSFYQDANQIPDYALKPVAAAATAGLVVNYPERALLNPQQTTTRADAAALIYQALVQSGKADRLDSAYIVQP